MSAAHAVLRGLSRTSRRLRACREGIALTEFALIMPFFLTIGLGGIEVTNYSLQTMRISQLASQIADNASRIGDYSSLENRKVYEGDINDTFLGADLAAGTGTSIFTNGRIIISSVEYKTSTGRQYIHWQRCIGLKRVTSSYGVEGADLTVGMGPAGREVYASTGDAVMFVEVQYDYQPLVGSSIIGTPTISSIASYTVRSKRDITQLYQRTPADPVMSCGKYTSTIS